MSLVPIGRVWLDGVACDDYKIRLFLQNQIFDKSLRVQEVLWVTIDEDITQLKNAEASVLVELQVSRLLLHFFNRCVFLCLSSLLSVDAADLRNCGSDCSRHQHLKFEAHSDLCY